ncbi:MAG: hypothetical protein J0I80_08265 [Sphingomonas sp.]|nr:hypothetical protein [Sphingomonas sp.]
MFKMLHPLFFVVPAAWLAILLLLGLNAVTPTLEAFGLAPNFRWVVLVVQALLGLLFLTPLWRIVWKIVPGLNRWFYPDLAGEWHVEVESNFSRIEALLDAAADQSASIDLRYCPAAMLPPLQRGLMRAKIKQSWVRMDMELWDPANEGPIKRSETIVVDPFRGSQGEHGLGYIFDQENDTDTPSDAACFRGAAWIIRDQNDPNILHGRMWNDRMWRRGMNTAANIKLTRVRPWRSCYQWLGSFRSRTPAA